VARRPGCASCFAPRSRGEPGARPGGAERGARRAGRAQYAWYDDEGAARKFGVEAEDAKKVRKLAHPFVDWLRTADEEEEDE
jgi:hypothetical protein